MPLSDDQLHDALVKLRGCVSEEDLAYARLILRVCGVPHGDLENAKSAFDLYKVIRKFFPGRNAVAILECVLVMVGVSVDEVKKLDCDENSLDACQHTMPPLASLLLLLSRGVSSKQFDDLKNLAQKLINTHPNDIPTPVEFFYTCLDQIVFDKAETLFEFRGYLKTIKRDDLATEVESYIRKEGIKDGYLEMELASFFVSLDGRLADEEFRKLTHLVQECLSIPPTTTRVEFFRVCSDKRIFEMEESLSEFCKCLKELKKKDLEGQLETYVEHIKQAASPDPEYESSNEEVQFSTSKQESGNTPQVDPERADLVGGASVNQPTVPKLLLARGFNTDKDDGSTRRLQYVRQHFPIENPSLQSPDRKGGEGGEDDDADSITSASQLLKCSKQGSFCHKHRWKIALSLCIITLGLLVVLLALTTIFLLIIVYHFPVDMKQREVEAMPGEVVQYDNLQGFLENLHLKKNFTADSSVVPYEVHVHSASQDELERLRESRSDYCSENMTFKAPPLPFTIPRGSPLPYLMVGSYVTVSLCLGTEQHLTTPTYAHLYLFNNRFITHDFLNNRTNGTSGAIHTSTLEVGGSGDMLCQSKGYPISEGDHGYYHIVLQVPPLSSGVMVNYNVSLDIVYINSSNLTQAKQCQTPCTRGFELSFSTHTILCYVRRTESSPEFAYLLVNKVARFVPEVTKISGFILLGLSSGTTLVTLVVIVCLCKRVHGRDNAPG